MNLGNMIAQYRKRLNITQESLAQQLGVTNQAVSKWESDQCCPDVMLLPKLADIFGIAIDELFGRTSVHQVSGLPWADDKTLRAVLYRGHTLLRNEPAAREITFTYKGEALNIDSAFSVACGDVGGKIDAGANVNCGNVDGDVDAGANVTCGNVSGNVDAGANILCGSIGGNADAGCFINFRK